MDDVPHDQHADTLQFPQSFDNCESVQQPLGGMLVGPVAGIDHRGLQPGGEEMGRTGRPVPDDDDPRLQGLQVLGCVRKRLAFAQTARILVQ